MNIKNYEKVLEELTAMLMQFAKDLNQYQTDVYLYYDEETQTAMLDTFINIGGNSWINDNHYTIYRDPQHNDSFFDSFFGEWSVSDFSLVLDVTVDELRRKTSECFDYDIDDVDDYDVIRFLKESEEYSEKLLDYYLDEIATSERDYAEQAEEILDNFLKEMETNEELYRDYEEMYHDYYES